MSSAIAASLISSRSFQTEPFIQKVNLTTGLRYIAGNNNQMIDDGQLEIFLKQKSTVGSF